MKKHIYTFLVICFLLLLTLYTYERSLLRAMDTNQTSDIYSTLTMAWMIVSMLSIGLGYFLAQHWWKIVYIEKRHWSDLMKKWKKK